MEAEYGYKKAATAKWGSGCDGVDDSNSLKPHESGKGIHRRDAEVGEMHSHRKSADPRESPFNAVDSCCLFTMETSCSSCC